MLSTDWPMDDIGSEWVGGIIVIVLLNYRDTKLSSKSLYLCPHICAILNFGKRNFFLQWVAVNAETYN